MLFLGQASSHHQPIHCSNDAAAETSVSSCVCLSSSVCPNVHAIQPTAVHDCVLTQNTGFQLCMPCKTEIWIPVFAAHSIIHHLFHHPSIYQSIHCLHPCINQSIHPSINPWLFNRIHPCFRKDKTPRGGLSFLLLKPQSLIQMRQTCFVILWVSKLTYISMKWIIQD